PTAVVAAVVPGGGLAGLGFPLIRALVGPNTTSIDVLEAAFTAVAGVGGAKALVVAYRRQNDLEQGRFVERFGAAAAQLDSPRPHHPQRTPGSPYALAQRRPTRRCRPRSASVAIGALPGTRHSVIEDAVYRWVAKHRYRFPETTPYCESHPGAC
ncbi:MAG TPA: hypothetical protein VE197_13820, partial [Mycobacterium sp.]|nr:hypothetical protein [Mycobacterium sp.]